LTDLSHKLYHKIKSSTHPITPTRWGPSNRFQPNHTTFHPKMAFQNQFYAI